MFYKIADIDITSCKRLGRRSCQCNFYGDKAETKKIFRAGEKLHPHSIDELFANEIKNISVIDFEAEGSLNSQMIINCFEREEIRFTKEGSDSDESSKDDALAAVYSVLLPGEPITIENAEKDLNTMFFSLRRYDLGRVGRYKLNKKFDYKENIEEHTLAKQDYSTMKYLIAVISEMNL